MLQVQLLQFISSFGGLCIIFTPGSSSEGNGVFDSKNKVIAIEVKGLSQSWQLNHRNIHQAPILSEQELYTLAHELGHAISQRQGYHTPQLDAVVAYHKEGFWNPFTQQIIFEEEIRAWQYAEWVLQTIGMKDFTQFYNDKKWCLDTYEPKVKAA